MFASNKKGLTRYYEKLRRKNSKVLALSVKHSEATYPDMRSEPKLLVI
ncbi:MAG: hypothetical protein RIS64_2097 [Bacteroidota bacterium]|jgi:hypothetical protein